jgi:hypothetical protein
VYSGMSLSRAVGRLNSLTPKSSRISIGSRWESVFSSSTFKWPTYATCAYAHTSPIDTLDRHARANAAHTGRA